MQHEIFEDRIRWSAREWQEQTSPYCDLVSYPSSVTPGIRLAMLVKKPAKPSYMLVSTHGWHQTLPEYRPMDAPDGESDYLRVYVDMRGRAYSQGEADCNAYELMDVYDAVRCALERYGHCLVSKDVIYFEGGSGGGGNALALAAKFPDMFAAVSALYGISDYARWYREDEKGEFRDEFDRWIGFPPDADEEAYASRSGIALVDNLHSPLFMAHGELDYRVPENHSAGYVAAAQKAGKGALVEYYMMRGVGAGRHVQNATEQQLEHLRARSEANRQAHRTPVALPPRGELWVGGYLVTRHFTVMLEDKGALARVAYDLEAGELRFTKEPRCPARVIWHDKK